MIFVEYKLYAETVALNKIYNFLIEGFWIN